jgi:hypothetical protein
LYDSTSVLYVADAWKLDQYAVAFCGLHDRLGSACAVGAVFDDTASGVQLVGGYGVPFLQGKSLQHQLQTAFEIKAISDVHVLLEETSYSRLVDKIDVACHQCKQENADKPGINVLSQENAPL